MLVYRNPRYHCYDIMCQQPLPVGDHTINVEVIRQPLQADQPVEHDIAKWNVKVTR